MPKNFFKLAPPSGGLYFTQFIRAGADGESLRQEISFLVDANFEPILKYA
tara:strand:+ start:4474 stop:4623 length:150 start_codon:yes stop_codon:yes gene_type:complete